MPHLRCFAANAKGITSKTAPGRFIHLFDGSDDPPATAGGTDLGRAGARAVIERPAAPVLGKTGKSGRNPETSD